MPCLFSNVPTGYRSVTDNVMTIKSETEGGQGKPPSSKSVRAMIKYMERKAENQNSRSHLRNHSRGSSTGSVRVTG